MRSDKPREDGPSRREFFAGIGRGASLLAVGGIAGAAATRLGGEELVWQLDPLRCTQCGKCATECVLDVSAVKCFHDFSMCGYCRACFGFLRAGQTADDSGAYKQMCPTDAIRRECIEWPHFEYTIDHDLCTGCAKCVEGCEKRGNGALYLQVSHDRCVNCNECSIARACPSEAFVRLPVSSPYLNKREGPDSG